MLIFRYSLLALFLLPVASTAFTISASLPEEGPASVGVYDESGILVRTLFSGEEKEEGELQISWDLLDDAGNPVAAGAYECRSLQGASVRPRYIATVGNGRQPWVPGDLGNVEALNLFDVIVDDEGFIYSSGGGHGRCVQKISPDGKELNAAVNVSAAEVISALAQDEDSIYAIGDEAMYRIRKSDMKFNHFQGKDLVIRFDDPPRYHEVRDSWRIPEQRDARVLELQQEALDCKLPDGSNDPRTHAWRGIMRHPFQFYECERMRGAAVWKGRLLISDYHYNLIRVHDTTTGELIEKWESIAEPNGIAVHNGDEVYIVSGKKILAINPDGKVVREVVSQGVERPGALAVGPKGNLYVVDLGIPNQVKVFDPGGQLLKTFGSSDPFHGTVRSDKLGIPRGIAVDGDGNVILSEMALNRVQKISSEWKPLWDLQAFYCYLGTHDQTDPQWIYGFEGPTFPTIKEYHLDYETGEWSWTKVWYAHKFDDGYSFYGYPSRGGGALTLNGNRYLYIFHKGLRIFRIKGDDLYPVVRFGPRVSFNKTDGTRADYMLSTAPTWTIWHDLNHDTLATEDEVSVLSDEEAAEQGLRWDSVDANITADGTVYFGNMAFSLQGVEDDIPRYSWDHVKAFELSDTGEALSRDGIGGVGVDPDENRYYGTRDIDSTGPFEGPSFWSKRIGRQNVNRFSPEGERIWQAGAKAAGMILQPGTFSYMTSLDWASGFVFVADMDGYLNVFSDDGLFVTRMFHGTREGAKQETDPYCITSHELGHVRTFDHPGNGGVYVVGQSLEGGEHIRVYEVEGLKDVKRTSVRFEVSAQDLDRVVAVAREMPRKIVALQKYIGITSVLRPPVVDGSLKTWTELTTPVEFGSSDGAIKIRWMLRYDEKYLYLGVECRGDDSPAMNTYYPEDIDSAWKSDNLSLYINTDPAVDRKRREYGEGDHHLFFPVSGSPEGQAMRPYSVRGTAFLEDAEYQVQRTGEQSWSLTGRIAWKSLGEYYPVPNDKLHLDLHLDFGNAEGTDHVMSLRWGGKQRPYADPSEWFAEGQIKYAR